MTPRSTLKSYFTKGAIPKESDFADLIDSMLNQDDDQVFKKPDDPLSIRATGAEELLLNFYPADQASTTPSWLLKQKPAGKPVLSIADTTGTSRLFIDSSTGNVGIGTTEPMSPLSVAGGVTIGANYAKTNVVPPDGLLVEGNVGIGTLTPGARLEVSGATSLNGGLTVSGQTQLSAEVGINAEPIIGQHLVITPAAGNTPFNVTDPLNKTNWLSVFANGNVIMNGGNVGIGTASPSAALHVTSSVGGNSYIALTNTDNSANMLTVLGGAPPSTLLLAAPLDNYLFFYWKDAYNTLYTAGLPGNLYTAGLPGTAS